MSKRKSITDKNHLKSLIYGSRHVWEHNYSVMDGKKVYVSDPKIWEQAFKDMADGKPHRVPYVKSTGLGNTYRTIKYRPVIYSPQRNKEVDADVTSKQVTQLAAIAERANTTLEYEKKNNIPHVDPKKLRKLKRRYLYNLDEVLEKKRRY